ncbi:MAG: mandelate racemase/muconate lactonizing enzyme family protein [Candidatus Bathyarchaeota archaeon]|nr:mandelate racemase/muconate lactonizing enzyme family protein [Candidatus Bathyarchaeota archaeon]
MKIVDVKVRRFEFPQVVPVREFSNGILTYRRGGKGILAVIEIITDEDLKGIGFGEFGNRLKNQVLGENPLNVEKIWQKMFMAWRKPVVKGRLIKELANIDISVWDLVGKITKQPIYKLLGGYRNRVPAYAAGGYYEEGKSVEDLAKEMASYVEEGYKAVKMKVGCLSIKEDVERVKAVRESIGDDVDLMVDANNAYKAYQAVKFAKAVEKYNPYWFEEPVRPDDVEGSLEVKRATVIPIASGENEYTRWGFRDLIEKRAVDIIQPDPKAVGGYTELRKVTAMASAYHIPFSPHGTGLHMLTAHGVAAFENGLIVETLARCSPLWRDKAISAVDFYEKNIEVRNGCIDLPNRPGLGIEINEKVAAKYEIKS